MDSPNFLLSALVYLLAAVLSVPLATRLGLGSVLGYLLAGVIIGPFALALVGDQTNVMHFAEFGVVMMLFLIGLELRPSVLWNMRRPILGLGGLQVLLTGLVIAGGLGFVSEMSWQTNVAIGLTLALSSTAIVLQLLTEKGLLKTVAGQNAFSVLLFQDIAVIPMMALLPLLALNPSTLSASVGHGNLIANLPGWLKVVVVSLTIASIVFGGRFVSAPVFRFIAETHLREIFTAFALLLVIAIAAVMQTIGLSPALGTFLAGVVLAESEFRHELEIDIEPFKGLLLGLFFITVGANIDFQLILDQPLVIIASVCALILVKMAVLALLGRLFRMNRNQGLLFTLALAQGGEFAFVLASFGLQSGVFNLLQASSLTVIVALSMLVSPLLLLMHEWLLGRESPQIAVPELSTIEPTQQVIIAGYGRFGQIVGRLLTAQGYHLTILDHSPSQIDLLRRFGNKVFYGDAARRDLLQAAGAENAQLLVIAVDQPDKTLEIIKIAQRHFPQLKILARAIDRRHTYELMRLNIAGMRRETFHSALHLGVDALKLMGIQPETAERAGAIFVEHDEQSLLLLSKLWGDDHSYGVAVRQRVEDLKQVLQNDQQAQAQINTCHVEQDANH